MVYIRFRFIEFI